ncbi:hypothetical protein [Prochlorococcus marinus]|uniref:hypothetical protein n=1 Tax=Prochlorococcus marinus TaxID=1219 RepID=UPI0022B507FE|nr:hypothetical protein [Prochlorococcus marinus]
MLDNYTIEQCKKDKGILQLKIKNLEHGIKQVEEMISESHMGEDILISLRRKIAESTQDLAILYLLKDS